VSFPTAPLGSMCDVLDRLRKPITKSARKAGEYPYYGATGIVDYVDGYLFDEPLVLLGEDGAKWGPGEQSAFSASGRYWVNNHAHIMRPNRSKLLDQWLIYYLNWQDLSPFITGLTVPKLNQERMREIPIPVPPLEEQRRIVAALDKAFAAIATATAIAEKNLASVGELFQCTIENVFSEQHADWEAASFEDCLNPIKYPAKVQRKAFLAEGAYPIISQEASFINGYWDDPEDLLRVPRPMVVFGDHTQVLKYVDFDFVLGADGVKLLLPKPAISGKFLYYFLKAHPMPSAGYARHYRHLKALTVCYPSLADQQAVTDRLDELGAVTSKLEDMYRLKIDTLSELKQSLLHRAFSGALTKPEPLAA